MWWVVACFQVDEGVIVDLKSRIGTFLMRFFCRLYISILFLNVSVLGSGLECMEIGFQSNACKHVISLIISALNVSSWPYTLLWV